MPIILGLDGGHSERTWTEFGEKTISGNFSLCNIVHWSVNQKRLQKLLYIQAKLWLER